MEDCFGMTPSTTIPWTMGSHPGIFVTTTLDDSTSSKDMGQPQGLGKGSEQDTDEGNQEVAVENMQDDDECDEEEGDADEVGQDKVAEEVEQTKAKGGDQTIEGAEAVDSLKKVEAEHKNPVFCGRPWEGHGRRSSTFHSGGGQEGRPHLAVTGVDQQGVVVQGGALERVKPDGVA